MFLAQDRRYPIVAREYGIPAVMGTFGEIRRLKDEEQIRVDGFNGSLHSRFLKDFFSSIDHNCKFVNARKSVKT